MALGSLSLFLDKHLSATKFGSCLLPKQAFSWSRTDGSLKRKMSASGHRTELFLCSVNISNTTSRCYWYTFNWKAEITFTGRGWGLTAIYLEINLRLCTCRSTSRNLLESSLTRFIGFSQLSLLGVQSRILVSDPGFQDQLSRRDAHDAALVFILASSLDILWTSFQRRLWTV